MTVHTLPAADLWLNLRREAEICAEREPVLSHLLDAALLYRDTPAEALTYLLADELAGTQLSAEKLREIFAECNDGAPEISAAALADLAAFVARDPAAASPLTVFLFFKGFHALEGYRFAHYLLKKGCPMMASALQSRIARCLGVDIHPAARLGRGIMMDHADGIVIGETAVIEDDVSLLHQVTLGGTGKEIGDRHPKIRTGVMIGAGAKILGNIEIGEGARIAAGSVVLEDVLPHVTVAGVPARVIGKAGCARPAEEMDQMLSGNKNAPTLPLFEDDLPLKDVRKA